jgi:hypothetical protein
VFSATNHAILTSPWFLGLLAKGARALLTGSITKQAGVETDLIDISTLPTDAGEATKAGGFSTPFLKEVD